MSDGQKISAAVMKLSTQIGRYVERSQGVQIGQLSHPRQQCPLQFVARQITARQPQQDRFSSSYLMCASMLPHRRLLNTLNWTQSPVRHFHSLPARQPACLSSRAVLATLNCNCHNTSFGLAAHDGCATMSGHTHTSHTVGKSDNGIIRETCAAFGLAQLCHATRGAGDAVPVIHAWIATRHPGTQVRIHCRGIDETCPLLQQHFPCTKPSAELGSRLEVTCDLSFTDSQLCDASEYLIWVYVYKGMHVECTGIRSSVYGHTPIARARARARRVCQSVAGAEASYQICRAMVGAEYRM